MMAKKSIATKNDFDLAVREAAAVLAGGGVTVFPTETVYGIGVASGNPESLAKLRGLKGRDMGKPFQFLAADMDMARGLGAVFSERADKLARAFWPGPMTMVVPDGTVDGGTLGIRIPDSEFVLAVSRELGRPIIASSANLAGGAPATTAEEADVFGSDVDLLVDGGAIVGGVPSTVVRCFGDDFGILRLGEVGAEALRDAWNE